MLGHAGPHTEEQPRPTEQMNGVLNDDELPPQVIKRYVLMQMSAHICKTCFFYCL